MAKRRISRRDLRLARRAKRHGARYALRILIECKRYGLPFSLGLALFEHESGFKNVFGHDPVQSIRGGRVTRARYRWYKIRRKAGLGMQGVGPGQLTWWETQDLADRKGGCWKPEVNIRVALLTLKARIREHGYVRGIQRYNGGGAAAVAYSSAVRKGARKWHRRLAVR